ncbi:MAG TPA: TetR/AcrR family transcriptional regulator [Deltaproteobacteria bacterium]|nr:TetR/AcrR family transcriptional regulator [Deltaproteobacteria bacterium]HPJ94905.1 TetR/AcrR family transcriptional regulator [Deltaproteobacteria bacterium]
MVQSPNDNSKPLSRKEREAALRKKAILDAARSTFEADGYINATMAQIAAKAEFGVGTLYQFFPSKQNLFAEVILQGIEQFREGLRQCIAEETSWQDELRLFIEYQLSWVEKNPDFHRLIYEIFYSPVPDLASRIFEVFKDTHKETMTLIQNIFSHANKDSEIFDPDLMSLMILGMMHVIGDNWFMGILNKKPTEYIPGIIGVILGGKSGE